MKKIFIIALMISNAAFATADCSKQVEAAFNKSQPRMNLISVSPNGQLAPGEDRPYMQEEIWNNSKITLDVYHIEAGFMARFAYAALVNPKTCEVKNIIEVFFQ